MLALTSHLMMLIVWVSLKQAWLQIILTILRRLGQSISRSAALVGCSRPPLSISIYQRCSNRRTQGHGVIYYYVQNKEIYQFLLFSSSRRPTNRRYERMMSIIKTKFLYRLRKFTVSDSNLVIMLMSVIVS